MKSLCLIPALLVFGTNCICQGVFSNQTNNVLEKVIQDYPSQFRNIKGELISNHEGAAEYRSTVSIPGSLSTNITQSGAGKKQWVSWQTIVYGGAGFTTASKRFEELFNQIRNTIIKPAGGKAAIVNGLYVPPLESNTFTTIQFDLVPVSPLLQNVNIDMMLRNTGKQWDIIITVYDREMNEHEAITVK